MNHADQTAVAANENTDAILNDLLGDLNDNIATLDAVIAADASAGVPGMADLLDDLAGLGDAVLESIENDGGAILAADATEGAEVVEADPVDAIIADAAFDAAELQTAIEVAAADAVVVPPKKGKKGAAKKGAAKKKTTVPAGYGSDAEETPPADEGKIEALGAEGEPDADPAPAAPAAVPAAPKPLRATSVTHKPGDLLLVKLGSDVAAELLVFDDRHDGEQIQAAHADFIGRMNNLNKDASDYIADKVKDKISMLLCWLAKGGELNEVLKRTITLLHKEGKLVSGDKGNLHLNLLAKPYSPGTARSQGNQMFMCLPDLQMVIKGKGTMEPNPNSPLLQMAYAALGLK